jgi:hypothetical protein
VRNFRLGLFILLAVLVVGNIFTHVMDWLHWNLYFLFRDDWLFLLVLLVILAFTLLPGGYRPRLRF